MKKLLFAAVVMASLVGTQVVAEARGGAGGGAGGNGSGVSTRMSLQSQGTMDAVRARQQIRLREHAQVKENATGVPTETQAQLRQQLRDPDLHIDTPVTPVIDIPDTPES